MDGSLGAADPTMGVGGKEVEMRSTAAFRGDTRPWVRRAGRYWWYALTLPRPLSSFWRDCVGFGTSW